jgi:hypothetical protein
MRHNQQNGRRFRGRNNNNGNGQGNHNHGHHGNHGGGNRRINPRVHTFDSNGPDVRIRGNAVQITEKYLTLARDAQASGDRVLAESYLQHAEHYQRMLGEMTEDYNRQQQLQQQQQQQPQQQNGNHNHNNRSEQGADNQGNQGTGEQPDVPLNDLDQGFLVGARNTGAKSAKNNTDDATSGDVADEDAADPVARPRRAASRQKATEAV